MGSSVESSYGKVSSSVGISVGNEDLQNWGLSTGRVVIWLRIWNWGRFFCWQLRWEGYCQTWGISTWRCSWSRIWNCEGFFWCQLTLIRFYQALGFSFGRYASSRIWISNGRLLWWNVRWGGWWNNGHDGVKEILNLELDERVWDIDTDKVSIIYSL